MFFALEQMDPLIHRLTLLSYQLNPCRYMQLLGHKGIRDYLSLKLERLRCQITDN